MNVGNPMPAPWAVNPLTYLLVVLVMELSAVGISTLGLVHFSKGGITKRESLRIAFIVEALSFIPGLLLWIYCLTWLYSLSYESLLSLFVGAFVVEISAVVISYLGLVHFSKGRITKRESLKIAVIVEVLSFLPSLLLWIFYLI